VPPSSALHVPTYLVALFGKYLCYAMLALSIDLIWGYCGILSLGHGAFFALGGYAMGMYLMRQIGTRGVYANPILPDFMVFLNWKELPLYWYGFQSFPLCLLMVVLVPGVLAFVFGWFAFRSRVTGVYLSIITQALTYALMLGFFRNEFRLRRQQRPDRLQGHSRLQRAGGDDARALFSISCVALMLGFSGLPRHRHLEVRQGADRIRDAESRTRFLGYRVESYKLFVFTLSACMAGIAGALYVPQVGIINPSEFAPANSIEAVIWVAVGGRGTLSGAALGAVLVNYAKTYFTSGFLPLLAVRMLGACSSRHAAVAARHHRHLRHWRRAAARPPSGRRRVRRSPSRCRRNEDARMSAHDRTLLYLDGVTVSFDGFKALNNLSLVIEPGEMRAIIGPNGAGKTTMMDVVTGKTRPDTGDVVFDGSHDLTRLDEPRSPSSASAASSRSRRCSTATPCSTISARAQRRPRARFTLWWRKAAERARTASTNPGDHPPDRACAIASPAACRTARSNGSKSACCWRRIPSCCWSTSRSPA
jgi:urea transport system permease protein